MILSKRSFNILFALFITSILPSPYLLYEQTPSTVPIAKNNSTLTNISVIPYPEFIDKKNSTVTISNGFRIISKQNLTEDLQLALHRYSKYISLLTGISVTINQTFLSPRNKLIIDCPSIISKIDKYPKLGEDESYKLNITKTGSYLYSLSLTGIIRGLSTFVQLIEQHESSNTFYIPLVNIIDRPRFMWRGLLLDVSRHWMPVPVIERTLNTMELSKFNVLHLHLSDDQGFRVEKMTKLFPDPYFHIGGDEVEGSQWTQSPTIQQFIKEHNLENNLGLQAYFNKRIQKLLKKYGKIMIGWEEILDEIHENQTIDKDAVIQTWLRQQATANAVKNGYQVIVSNGYYLNRLLSSINYYKVDPILRNNLYLPREQQQNNILGGEACVWSEYIAANSVDSRIWPHALAIAERLWSPSSITNENFLYERLFRMNHLFDTMQTGVTHISLYKSQLQNFILDPKKKLDLLQPLIILADVCEPCGPQERSKIYTYSANTPLTTFTDVLQSESELIWKLGKLPINDELSYRDIFQTWSINHLLLRELFDNIEKTKNQKIWGQDIEQLSLNLANTGQIGLRILDYNSKKILNSDKNNIMNSWTLSYWICYHKTLLRQLEIQVKEVRLAAVRPVLRLFDSIQTIP
ncbi:unnamed protein product [Rotaria sordida]|uniref:beta-N-acetylhexosaminidase n=1 Tax=Rotaria sordida TaxID=392033 RepID=A0A815GS27_9BILA|nr:unnamed protein product [Rotaria sordida]